MNKEEFLKRADFIYHGRYDLSTCGYENIKSVLSLTCNKHGDFQVSAFSFIYNRKACPKCKKTYGHRKSRQQPEIFVEKARKVWGDRYDYSKVKNIQAHQKVAIICPLHGEFEQDPYNHLDGHYGCKACKEASTDRQEAFLRKAQAKYGDAYTYDNVHYVDYKTPVKITCAIHGDFEVTPTNFLSQGWICPTCTIKKKIRRGAQLSGLTAAEFAYLREVLDDYTKKNKEPA